MVTFSLKKSYGHQTQAMAFSFLVYLYNARSFLSLVERSSGRLHQMVDFRVQSRQISSPRRRNCVRFLHRSNHEEVRTLELQSRTVRAGPRTTIAGTDENNIKCKYCSHTCNWFCTLSYWTSTILF